MAETARANGLEPQIQCIMKISNRTDSSAVDGSVSMCFDALKSGDAEVVVANADWQVEAKR